MAMLGGGMPIVDKTPPAERPPLKFDFVGLEEMWKKIVQGDQEDEMISLNRLQLERLKGIENNTKGLNKKDQDFVGVVKKFADNVVDGIKKLPGRLGF